ncbi:MAG: hypothetical protein LQ350_008567 [Teloschistes chrysophthalmus]|nr:MAG: hypothetical protein LQ350_008567 [Niorma chrysophthalma]
MAPTSNLPAIVLVHGAWHVPQHYQSFIDRLERIGFEIYCPLLPTCDESERLHANMYQDAELIRNTVRSLADRNLDIIMLLHSYGGAPGAEAVKGFSKEERKDNGLAGGVVHLVYMCGFMLQPGECVGGASLPRPVPDPVERDEATGTTFLLEPRIPLFYADVEPDLAGKMEALLVRQSGPAMTDEVTYPAWQYVPVTYIRTQDDRVLFPEWQARQIKAVKDAGVEPEVEVLETSHSPFLSKPEKIAKVVMKVVMKVSGVSV